MGKKNKVVDDIKYSSFTNIVGSIFLIIISYFVFSNILKRYPADILQFLYALNPIYYLKHLNLSTILTNLKEIFFLFIFVYASISVGKFFSYIGFLPYKNISIAYLVGVFLNSIIMLITGFLGYISKNFYIFVITFESIVGVYLILKKEFKFDISLKDDIKQNKMTFVVFLYISLLSLIGALSPEIFYDSLNYHLGAANWWLIEGKIVDMPSHMFYKLPLSHSLIYAFSLSVFGEQTPLLINFITLVFMALFIAYGFRDFISQKTSITAAFIFISIFHVFISAQSATADILSSFASIVCFRMLLDGAVTNTNNLKFLLWAGISCGFAFSSKYNTSFITLPFVLLYIYLRIKHNHSFKKLSKELFIFLAGFFIFSAPWMIKNLKHYSNPLFPFAHSLFSPSTSPYELERIKGFINEVKQFEKINLKQWLTLPIDISLGKIPNSELFLPLFIIILPTAFLNKKKNLFIKYLWICFGVSYLMWSLTTTYIRHFFSSFSVISILTAYYINEAFKNSLKQIIKAIYLLAMFLNTVYLTNYFTLERRFEPVFGFITREEYLSKSRMRYPYPSYSMYRYINNNLPADSKILIFGDSRSFYLTLHHQTASVFDKHPLIEVVEESKDGEEIYKRLKKAGFTHILLNLAEGYRTKAYGNCYFNLEDFKKFDDFFKNHIMVENEIEEKKGNQIVQKIILYTIVEKNISQPFNYFSYFIAPHQT